MLIVFWLLNQVDGKWPLTENCVAEINGWRTPTRSCWRGLPRTHTLSDTSEKILLKPRKTCVYRCSYHWVSRSFSLPASLNLNKHAYWRAFFSTLSVLIEYVQGWTHVPLLPFDGALGANTFFSSALAAESTAVGDALLLAGVSYT